MGSYFKVGKLAASTGLLGAVILEHSLGKKSALEGLKVIFLEEGKDNFIPYFIEKATPRNTTEVVLQLEGVETVEAARKLTPKQAWLQEEDFEKYTAASSSMSLLNYEIVDADTEESLGTITEVIEMAHQLLCTIMYKDKEVLIPVHSDNLVKTDKKKRQLIVEIPAGLIDIYM